MNQLTIERRAQIIRCLVEGMSIRATVRTTGASKNTIAKPLADLGSACLDYQDAVMRDLPCKRLQCDEVWAFCYSKAKNVPDELKGKFGYGDVWTWTAIDAETKLVPCWYVGGHDGEDARMFIDDLAARLASRVQLTTDGLKAYVEAVEGAFGPDIDYAQLIKLYGPEPEGAKRYSPPKCNGEIRQRVIGNPNKRHVSTSYVERQNLTMRMSMRRFTRLTNAFSKKVENLMHAVALHFMYYNFARPHQTLSKPYPKTPAMAAGVADHVWSIEEIVGLLD